MLFIWILWGIWSCYNIFNRAAGDELSSDLSLTGRMMLMSTYEELQFVVSVAVLIVAILSYTHKK